MARHGRCLSWTVLAGAAVLGILALAGGCASTNGPTAPTAQAPAGQRDPFGHFDPSREYGQANLEVPAETQLRMEVY